MRAQGKIRQATCPKCNHNFMSASGKGQAYCPKCGKCITFDHEAHSLWMRNWRLKNPIKDRRHKDNTNERNRRLYHKLREERGNRCDLCSISEMRLELHEKNGKHHPQNPVYYIKNRPEDFVLLCHRCHKGAQWALEVFNLSYEQFKEMTLRFVRPELANLLR